MLFVTDDRGSADPTAHHSEHAEEGLRIFFRRRLWELAVRDDFFGAASVGITAPEAVDAGTGREPGTLNSCDPTHGYRD